MTERMTRNEVWGWFEHPLTNTEVVEKGEMACFDTATGLLTRGAVSLTLRPIGYFEDNVTGDGTTNVRIRLFDDVRLHWWANDTGTPVVAADIGSLAYIFDDRTVTGDSTGASVAGRVFAVNTVNGVMVSMVDDDIGVPTSFASGEYAPTLTDVTNVAASALLGARFVRINNTVTVFFGVTIDPTAAAATELGISLPVASTLAAAADLLGHMASGETVGEPAVIVGDVANDRAQLSYTAVGTGVVTWHGSFSYQVL